MTLAPARADHVEQRGEGAGPVVEGDPQAATAARRAPGPAG